MLSKFAKDLVIKSGSYNIKQFENHSANYDPVLSELTGQNINGKANLKRLFDLDIKSHDEVVTDIVKSFNTDTVIEQPVYNFVDTITTTVEKMHLLQRVSFDQQTQSNDYFIYIIKNNLFQPVIAGSKQNILDQENLELLLQMLAKKFCSGDLPQLYELLKASQVSEILSCTCIDHKFLMLLGAKIFIPYIFSLYEKGNFKFILNELIYRLNFKAIQVNVFSLKYKAFQVIIPATMFISGYFFNTGIKGINELQELKHLYETAVKEYKFDGKLGLAIEDTTSVLKKTGSAAGSLIKAPFQGLYFAVLQPVVESLFLAAEWFSNKGK